MKHYKRLILITLLFILAGCNTRELEFERAYPDMTEINELRAEIQKERHSSPDYQKYMHLINSNIQPLELSLFSAREDNSVEVFEIVATDFCWKEMALDCYHLEDSLILNNADLNLPVYTIKKRKPMTLDTLAISDETPVPTRVEFSLYNFEQHRQGNSYYMSSDHTYEFEAPEETGSYIYIFKAFYESSIGGVALFPVVLNVTE